MLGVKVHLFMHLKMLSEVTTILKVRHRLRLLVTREFGEKRKALCGHMVNKVVKEGKEFLKFYVTL